MSTDQTILPSLPQKGLDCFWHTESETEPDTYVAFRGTFDLEDAAEIEFTLLGASWYVVSLDGTFFTEGPARFAKDNPEYQICRAHLPAGRHVLAVQVHHLGVPMRILDNVPPFFWCLARTDAGEIAVEWKVQLLDGYHSQSRRINAQLGWIEWCDTRKVPHWQAVDYDDSAWLKPHLVMRDLAPLKPLSTANTQSFTQAVNSINEGQLTEIFGYERDDPSARFFLRDLAPQSLPPQGVWRRYDLGRVRLMRPCFDLDLPSGAVVEFAYCEALRQGRVSPWIPLSASDSCNFDHYIARGGPQTFFPLTPKGGRFVEIHVLAPPGQVQFLKEEIVERGYYGRADGAFGCDDELLNRIWLVGVETHKACSEDALVDNPTRERGQWAGDVVTVGMDIAGAAFSDLRMCRRGLVQCAQSARADGLVSGMCPGQNIYLSTYAAQWVSACVHYWELTGEILILEEMLESAVRNLGAFEAKFTPQGLDASLGWGFVDWGYVPNPGSSDMGVNLHYLAALRAMQRWCDAIGQPEASAHYSRLAERMTALIGTYYAAEFGRGDQAWEQIGYHRTALGLHLGFFGTEREKQAVDFLKAHMMRCFPNDASAPRLSDPGANHPRLITPYFAHYALPVLIERGEIDFVLDQYRRCWGWALGDGRTTWLEVFDTRWSHCHQWAGCPTWQISRYLLGLQARQDLGIGHYVLSLVPGSLNGASGLVPISGTDHVISVRWKREPPSISYCLETPILLTLHIQEAGAEPRTVEVQGTFTTTLRDNPKRTESRW